MNTIKNVLKSLKGYRQIRRGEVIPKEHYFFDFDSNMLILCDCGVGSDTEEFIRANANDKTCIIKK